MSVFDRMHRRLGDEGVRFEVVAGNPEGSAPEARRRPWMEPRPARRWNVAGAELLWNPGVSGLKDTDLVIVQQELRRLTNLPLLTWQHAGGPAVAFFGHGRTPAIRWGGGASYRSAVAPSLADRAKAAVSRRPHWWFAYNDLSARIVAELGFPPDRITSVRNAIDTAALRSSLRGQPEPARLRRQLGIPEGPVVLYCGRLYAEKRLQFLVEALDAARQRVPTLQFLVVGEGPDRPRMETAARSRPWMHLVGPVYGDEKVARFALAEVMVMPGNVGLAVLDALALETPLVTSRTSDHNPELDYLRDGRNGIIVDDRADPTVYGAAVADLLTSPERLEALRDGCREDADRYSVDTMAERFSTGILDALRAPRRGTVGHRP